MAGLQIRAHDVTEKRVGSAIIKEQLDYALTVHLDPKYLQSIEALY
jgi:hypothetical protein